MSPAQTEAPSLPNLTRPFPLPRTCASTVRAEAEGSPSVRSCRTSSHAVRCPWSRLRIAARKVAISIGSAELQHLSFEPSASELFHGATVGQLNAHSAFIYLKFDWALHPTRVFPFRGKPIGTMNKNGWQRIRREAGLNQVRLHDLRHTFACRLRAAGVSAEDRAALLVPTPIVRLLATTPAPTSGD